ncbi:MAG: redoxin domain-containing protein [Planctomycetota bacterium]|jgi:peroxiredoxin
MKRKANLLAFVLLGIAVLGLTALAGPPEKAQKTKGAKLGEKVPDFTLLDTKGQERRLAHYKDKIVVLEWISTECPYVINCYDTKAMTGAYEACKELDKGVVWLAINTTHWTNAKQNENWIEKYKLNYPILLDADGEVGKLYDARRTPHMFVIDAEGVLRYHGAIDDNPFARKPAEDATNYVVNAVKQIVGGETVSPDYVKPYGCAVKYRR